MNLLVEVKDQTPLRQFSWIDIQSQKDYADWVTLVLTDSLEFKYGLCPVR